MLSYPFKYRLLQLERHVRTNGYASCCHTCSNTGFYNTTDAFPEMKWTSCHTCSNTSFYNKVGETYTDTETVVIPAQIQASTTAGSAEYADRG